MRKCFCLLLLLHFTEGCHLSDHRKTKDVTAYTGGSILLPCSCTDPQSTVNTFIWLHLTTTTDWIKVFEEESFTGRLKLFDESSPANLSLLISDLRKKDEGFYRCQISESYTSIRVKIKECDLDQSERVELKGQSGGFVVLPCSWTELQAKPPQLTWTFTPLNQTEPEEIYPNQQSERHRGRVQLLNPTSPGNLSLLISDLKTEDQGEYRCSVLQQPHVTITLSVQDDGLQTKTEDKTIFILLSVLPVLMLLAVLALIWKCRGRRDVNKMTNDGLVLVCSENEKQADIIPDSLTEGKNFKQHEDEVTYTSVVHVKTAAKPAHKQSVVEEHSEYASIK